MVEHMEMEQPVTPNAVAVIPTDATAPKENSPVNPFLEPLANIVSILSDGADHPEVWAALAEAAQHDIDDLFQLIVDLGPNQTGLMAKSLDLVGAVLYTIAKNREKGLAFLKEKLNTYPHCVQVAGAIFFVSRHGQEGPSPDLIGRFCDAPFTKFETLANGTVAPCCSIWTPKRLGHLNGQTAEQIWNSPDAQAMRASIHDGSFRFCNKLRCIFINEDTLPEAASVRDPAMRPIIEEQQTVLDSKPSWLFLAHDVTCNLGCPSCRSGIVAASEADERRFDIIERDVLQPLLASEKPVRLSMSGQGDPWSSPHYRSILRHLADHPRSIELNLHTNALLMTEKRWAEYAGLDRYKALLDVSIDACTPWVYHSVRRPGKWDRLLPNLRFIADKRRAGEFREFHINATIQLDNFHEMGALVSFAEDIGADSARLYMIQNTGDYIARQYARLNIAADSHPLHLAFLETLRDARLGAATAHLYDVAHWRAHALQSNLPSDRLGADYSRADLQAAIVDAMGQPGEVVALCAAGRIRFPQDVDLPLYEAQALNDLGFPEQAGYRLKERIALGGSDVRLVGAGVQAAASMH